MKLVCVSQVLMSWFGLSFPSLPLLSSLSCSALFFLCVWARVVTTHWISMARPNPPVACPPRLPVCSSTNSSWGSSCGTRTNGSARRSRPCLDTPTCRPPSYTSARPPHTSCWNPHPPGSAQGESCAWKSVWWCLSWHYLDPHMCPAYDWMGPWSWKSYITLSS